MTPTILVLATILFVGDDAPHQVRIPKEKCEAIAGALRAGDEVWAHDRENAITRQIEMAKCEEATS